MPAERYYISEKLDTNCKRVVKGAEFHHLAHVMRTRKGDQVEILNGEGVVGFGTVQEILRDQAVVSIEKIERQTLFLPKMILAQAMPKPNRLDFILEKGTELGVDEFWLFPGQTSVKKEIYPNQIERAHSVTIAAMKQCGRLTLPTVIIKPMISQWSAFTSSAFFGDVSPDAPLFSKTWNSPTAPIIFVTGPESGFTEEEVLQLKKNEAVGIKLHDNILRTDTASLTALSLIRHWLLG